jgi:hypothetical protein
MDPHHRVDLPERVYTHSAQPMIVHPFTHHTRCLYLAWKKLYKSLSVRERLQVRTQVTALHHKRFAWFDVWAVTYID